MGSLQIDCPLCCCKSFDSKQSLLEHLVDAADKLYCPLCNMKCDSLNSLIAHLSQSDCHITQSNAVSNIVIYEHGSNDTGNSVDDKNISRIADELNTEFITNQTYECQDSTGDVNKMYELILKPHDLKLIKEEGDSRYIIVNPDVGESNNMSTIVTKQNSDGTVSLTSSKDVKEESETLIVLEPDMSDSNAEMYNCNACKISFTSVYEHIQNYHNDQEVVLEDIPSEIEPENGQIPMDSDCQEGDEGSSSEKQTARRVITDTGDIVEEPVNSTTEAVEEQSIAEIKSSKLVLDKQVRVYTRRLVQINKSDKTVNKSVVKNEAKERTGTVNPYHKVVTKEIQTEDGLTITMYHCLLCNVNVKSPNEFENYACKLRCHYTQVLTSKNVKLEKKYVVNFKSSNRWYEMPHKPYPDERGCVLSKAEHTLSCFCKFDVYYEISLKYSCQFCPAVYENSKSFCAHLKVHKETPDGSTDPSTSYECEVCSTVFLTNKSLKLHKRMHDPVKARPIEPPVENNDGTNLTGSVYRCNICDKMIPFDYRKIHENSHKVGDKNMNCGICNKKFTSIEYLEMHMNVHNVDKVAVNKTDKSLPYECVYCNRRFARPHEKVKHERIHTGEKPHACEICGKSFRVSYCLTLHMRTHTGARPYACQHCGKRFKAHSVYNHHLLTHSEVRAYKCPYCPKAFKTSVQLAGHKNSHTKPFSCQQCNRPFASLYAVRIHTETHARQNNLKFSCTLCGASYAREFALKDHVKQVHKQEVDGEEITNYMTDLELIVP